MPTIHYSRTDLLCADHASGSNMLDLFDEFNKVVTFLAERNIDRFHAS